MPTGFCEAELVVADPGNVQLHAVGAPLVISVKLIHVPTQKLVALVLNAAIGKAEITLQSTVSVPGKGGVRIIGVVLDDIPPVVLVNPASEVTVATAPGGVTLKSKQPLFPFASVFIT